MPRKLVCDRCGKPIEQSRTGRPRRYCSQNCRQQSYIRAKETGEQRPEALLNDTPAVAGEIHDSRYVVYRAWPLIGQHVTGQLTNDDVAEIFGIDERTASRWLGNYKAELQVEQASLKFRMSDEASAMLAPTVDGFVKLWKFLLPKTSKIAAFHREWVEALLGVEAGAGRLAIQGPQRYGKTSLLAVAMVRSIVIDPNCCLLYVGRTLGLAKQTTGLVRAIFEEHPRIHDMFLPEGAAFRPARSSQYSWTDEEGTVATRSQIRRSPTWAAVGAGGTILGRDADKIYCDDLEDFRNAQSPTQRDSLKEWFTGDLQSRKEEHTSWFYIGSAQHPEDLLSMMRTDPQWKVRVYAAHDPKCAKEMWVPDPSDQSEPANAHEHRRCVLWPEVRSYRWLFQQRQSARNKTQWDMNMLGVVEDGRLRVFTRELVNDALDATSRMGNPDRSWRLIGGLDPGGGGRSGFLSAVLIGVDDDDRRHIVDIWDEPSGGLSSIRQVFHQWHQNYGLSHWVVEMNIAKAYLYDDHLLSEIRNRCRIHIDEHHTGANKLDQVVGVPSLKENFLEGRYVVPTGDEQSRAKAEEWERQFRVWKPRIVSRDGYRFDLVMATWFPEKTIRDWGQTSVLETDVDYRYDTNVYAGAY